MRCELYYAIFMHLASLWEGVDLSNVTCIICCQLIWVFMQVRVRAYDSLTGWCCGKLKKASCRAI